LCSSGPNGERQAEVGNLPPNQPYIERVLSVHFFKAMAQASIDMSKGKRALSQEDRSQLSKRKRQNSVDRLAEFQSSQRFLVEEFVKELDSLESTRVPSVFYGRAFVKALINFAQGVDPADWNSLFNVKDKDYSSVAAYVKLHGFYKTALEEEVRKCPLISAQEPLNTPTDLESM